MDLILFELFDETFALSASCVREVSSLAPVTPLPFVDRAVDGLVGLAGSVVTQINLAARLGMERSLAEEEGVLLLVEIAGIPHALHIHRMVGLARIEEEEIHPTESGAAEDAPLPHRCRPGGQTLVGEFSWKERTVLLLNANHLGVPNLLAASLTGGDTGILAGQEPPPGRDEQGLPCLVMDAGGGHYALCLSHVREVLEAGRITPLPHAPPEVAGITFLRQTPHLVLSLNRLLGGGQDEEEQILVLVQREEWILGLLVGKLSGIQRFPEKNRHPAGVGESDLECYLRGRGEEMIGLLSLSGLLSGGHLARWKPFLPVRHAVGAAESGRRASSRPYLACLVGEERCLIPLELVERVTEFKPFDPLPGHDNPYLAGVVQLHGEVLPVSDMAHLLRQGRGEPTAYVVIRLGEEGWAVAVDRLFRVVEASEENIETVGSEPGSFVQAVGRLHDQIYSVLGFEPLAKAA